MAVLLVHCGEQCDFHFDLFFTLVLVFQLFFSFSFILVSQYFFVLVLVLPVIFSKHKQPKNIKPADKYVLMICLNTVHR